VTHVYIVLENNDKAEGRGPMIPVCAFRTKEDADHAAAILFAADVKILPLFDSHHEFDSHQSTTERDAALKKLTTRERAILGRTKGTP
jgi:hypothetical protein